MKRATQTKTTWQLSGRDVVVSNLDKLFWPEQRLTKGDLLAFYRDIAPTLLPYLRQRRLIMRLWPDGIGGKSLRPSLSGHSSFRSCRRRRKLPTPAKQHAAL